MKISYLKHIEIDYLKWDKCVRGAFNGTVAAFSWYLDIVANDWNALVMGDYEYVMPLTVHKRLHIHYIYQPFFAQQLGIFTAQLLSPEIYTQFLSAIPRNYRYVELKLNCFYKLNVHTFKTQEYQLYKLDLMSTFQELQTKFSPSVKEQVNKGLKNGLTIRSTLTMEEFIQLTTQSLDKFSKQLKINYIETLRHLTTLAFRYRVAEIFGVYNSKNELCCAALFLVSHQKIHFLSTALNLEARTNGALFLVLEVFFRKNCERNFTFYFEPSDNENVIQFYKSFGASPVKYLTAKRNTLPFFVRWFKK